MDARLDKRRVRKIRRGAPARMNRKRDRRAADPNAAGLTMLPAEQPLAMPTQDFRAWDGDGHGGINQRAVARNHAWRQALLFGIGLVATVLFAWKLYLVLAVHSLTPVQAVFLVLCTLSFAWVAVGTTSALIGFVALLKGAPVSADSPVALPEREITLTERTAMLFPVYHEEPARIAATIEAVGDELDALGASRAFDVFILSDSRSQQAAQAEARAFSALARRLDGRLQVYYRRREVNVDKKAGNVAEWVRRFGAGYEHFIVFDADSVMSATLVVQLAGAMEANANAGLIQTVPRLVGGKTTFARLQQFAAGYYGPTVAAGVSWWHQGQSNYWGHNAILRTRAFASAAGLPPLPGRAPLGGHIQSHDFVEAALLQRDGWGVHMVPTAPGSYEGCPPSLIDLVVRDRRWAQGNLQHIRLLRAKGLTPLSRTHMAMGALAYIVSGVWALSLIVGIVLALQSKHYIPSYFSDQITLFPVWPEIDAIGALQLLIATFSVVLLPKLLGAAHALRSRDARGAPKDGARLIAGILFEMLFSMLFAPVLMVTQTTALVEVVAGKDSGWKAQRRDDGGIGLGQILDFHQWHVVLGLTVAALCWWVSPQVLGWMSTIVLGLVLSVLLSWITAFAAPGLVAWLLATEEDIEPPAIVIRADARLAEWRTRLNQQSEKSGRREGARNSDWLIEAA